MKEITAPELFERMNKGEYFMLVDVREPYEHEEFNIGGMNIPLADLPHQTQQINESPDVEIVLYCRSGNRSGMAQKILAVQFDMHNTVNLVGGMVSWQQHKLPPA